MTLNFRGLNFNCAIFDMDGTILDSMGMWHTASDRLLISKGRTPRADLWDNVKRKNLIETAEYLIREYEIPESVEEICDAIRAQTLKEYAENLQLKENAEELLKFLNEKGVPCILATATDRKCTLACLHRLQIGKYFTEVLTCLDLNTSKTKPLIFETAARAGKSTPESSIVFEDALHCIRTAAQAGFNVCAVYDKSDEEKTEPPESDWERIIKIADTSVLSLKEVLEEIK